MITEEEFFYKVENEGLGYALEQYYGRITVVGRPELTERIHKIQDLLEEIREDLLDIERGRT